MHRLLFLFIALPLSLSAQKQGKALIDSLSAVLHTFNEDTHKVNVLDDISFCYYAIAPDSGTKYANQMMALAQKLGWQKGMAAAYNNLGANAEARAEHTLAEEHYRNAIRLFEKSGNKKRLARALVNLGQVYANQGDGKSALDYCFNALKIFEEIKNDFGRATLLQNIGCLYFDMKDYPKAKKYNSEALALFEKIGNKASAASTRINIGNVHNAAGEYREALENYFAVLQTHTELGNKRNMCIALGNIGDVYSGMEDYTNALKYLQQSLDLSKEMNSTHGTAAALGNIGEVWYKIATSRKGNNPDKAALQKAVNNLSQAVALCKSINFIPPMMIFNETLSEVYYASGQYKQAYETFTGHVKMKDSIFSDENKMEIARLEAKREADLRNKDLVILDKQGKINKLKEEVKRNERIIYIVSIALLLVLASLALKYLNAFRRSNRKLRRETSSQKRVLNEIAMLHAHSVRRPIASILGLVSLFNHKDTTDPTNKDVIDGVTAMAEELDDVVKEIVKKENDLGMQN